MAISLIIADDQKLFRQGVVAILKNFDNIKLFGEASNGVELVNKVENFKPEVILMDLEMPIMDGIRATEVIKEKYPEIKILILTVHDEDSFILELMRRGANGYLIKDNTDPKELKEAIETVVYNDFYFNERVSRTLLKEITKQQLVKPRFNNSVELRELEVRILKLICEELTSAQIADKLHKSPRTIESYRRDLMDKIGAKSVVGLVIFSIQEQIWP